MYAIAFVLFMAFPMIAFPWVRCMFIYTCVLLYYIRTCMFVTCVHFVCVVYEVKGVVCVKPDSVN